MANTPTVAPRPDNPPPWQPAPPGGTLDPHYGRRRPKMYQLTKTDMKSLSFLNATTVGCFTLMGFCFNFWLSVKMSKAFSAAGELSEVGVFLSDKAWISLVAAAFFFLCGIGSMFFCHSFMSQIENETQFGPDA